MSLRTDVNTEMAAKKMSAVIEKKTGVLITPEQIENLIRDHWAFLSAYAHAIHRQQKAKKHD